MTNLPQPASNVGSLPDLDVSVIEALHFLARTELPAFPEPRHGRSLVVGSGNAGPVGRALFAGTDAIFATESDMEERLSVASVDDVVVISASGGKHAPALVEQAKEKGKPVLLLTNTAGSAAEALLDAVSGDKVVVFPKRPEPYTYNVSTYLSMLLAKTAEDPAAIAAFIEEKVAPLCDKEVLGRDAFVVTVPARFAPAADMLQTKFDELFGSRVRGRVYTEEEVKHAKTVVRAEGEISMAFGEEGESGFTVPLPENCGAAGMMSVGYFVVGRIQAAHPPYFKDSIGRYLTEASRAFGGDAPPLIG